MQKNITNRYRTYIHNENGKYIVKSWIQDKCIICGRFLRKWQRKYCSSCVKKRYKYSDIYSNCIICGKRIWKNNKRTGKCKSCSLFKNKNNRFCKDGDKV